MSDTWLGIILLIVGVLVWRFSLNATRKAYRFILKQAGDRKKRLDWIYGGLWPLLRFWTRFAAAITAAFGGWKLFRALETTSPERLMLLGWPLAVAGAVLLVLYYKEVKDYNNWWDKVLNWKGHVGWIAITIAAIPLFVLYTK